MCKRVGFSCVKYELRHHKSLRDANCRDFLYKGELEKAVHRLPEETTVSGGRISLEAIYMLSDQVL